MQSFRPALAELAQLQQSTGAAEVDFPGKTLGVIPAAYFEGKRIAAFQLASGSSCLDLRSVETHAALRILLAAELTASGYSGVFNFGEIIGSDYTVTQQIARWAFGAGYGSIVYPSAHDNALSWALFDRVKIIPVGDPEIIQRDDPDLVAAAKLFGLIVRK
jgi:hypothetical protein